MKSPLLAWLLGLILMLATPSISTAQEDTELNARLDTYAEKVKIEESSTALTWLLLVGLGVLCFSVLFKDAKRSHLD